MMSKNLTKNITKYKSISLSLFHSVSLSLCTNKHLDKKVSRSRGNGTFHSKPRATSAMSRLGHVRQDRASGGVFPTASPGCSALCVRERGPRFASEGRFGRALRLQGAIACCVARQQGGQVCRLATREVGRAVAQRPVAFPTVSLCVARRSGCRGPGGCRNPCPLCVGSRAAMADISGSESRAGARVMLDRGTGAARVLVVRRATV